MYCSIPCGYRRVHYNTLDSNCQKPDGIKDKKMGNEGVGRIKSINWNLSVLKFQNLICNFTNGFIACINFYGIKHLIHTNPSDASVNDIGSAESASNIG